MFGLPVQPVHDAAQEDGVVRALAVRPQRLADEVGLAELDAVLHPLGGGVLAADGDGAGKVQHGGAQLRQHLAERHRVDGVAAPTSSRRRVVPGRAAVWAMPGPAPRAMPPSMDWKVRRVRGFCSSQAYQSVDGFPSTSERSSEGHRVKRRESQNSMLSA